MGITPIAFPLPTQSDETELVILKPDKTFFQNPPTLFGNLRSVNESLAMESTIKRVESVSRIALTEVRREVVEKLAETNLNEDNDSWVRKIRCSGDTITNPIKGQNILNQAFDNFLYSAPLPTHLGIPFAQAYLNSDNPWSTRFTPIPSDPTM